MYLSTSLISQPLWMHQIILLGWLNRIHTLEDRQIIGVCVRLSPLPPTQPQQGFISGTKVGKSRAKHSGASTLKREPLHICRKISLPVNKYPLPLCHKSPILLHPHDILLVWDSKEIINSLKMNLWQWVSSFAIHMTVTMRGFWCNPALFCLDSTVLSYSPKVKSPCDFKGVRSFQGCCNPTESRGWVKGVAVYWISP